MASLPNQNALRVSFFILQVSPASTFELIVDELLYLELVGIDVRGPQQQWVHVKAKFLFASGDYPGLHSVMGKLFKQQPSEFADYKSWFGGSRVGSYKMLYDPHLM